MAITRSYEEVLDLIVSVTSPQRLLRFHLSGPSQARLSELVARAERGELTAEDAPELELCLDLKRAFADIRALARQRLLTQGTDAL
ncbi:hypothetical protein BH23GEM7_BH23GEM7_22930 [soil metagenome]|jgi:hypothetical protein